MFLVNGEALFQLFDEGIGHEALSAKTVASQGH